MPTMGSRLTFNGAGDAKIRLGWKASNASYPWTAVGTSGSRHRTGAGSPGQQPGGAAAVAVADQQPDIAGPSPLISLAEVARLTGRHPEALRALVRRGRLTAPRGNNGRLLLRLAGCGRPRDPGR